MAWTKILANLEIEPLMWETKHSGTELYTKSCEKSVHSLAILRRTLRKNESMICTHRICTKILRKLDEYSTTGVVKVDFPGFSRNSTNFNWLYLRAPEELDKKKPHFRAFQLEYFPTRRRSFETKNSRKSYGRLKIVTKCKNPIRSDTTLTIHPPQRAKRRDCVKKFKNFVLIV